MDRKFWTNMVRLLIEPGIHTFDFFFIVINIIIIDIMVIT